MTDSRFQPGTLVLDNRSKLGRVVSAAGTVDVDGVAERQFTVDFWGEDERRLERWLTPVDEDCPEALLLNRPTDLARWADEAPLKLVALALAVDGGSGQVSDIRAKLEGRVVDESQWKNWWSKRTKVLSSLPEHFNSVKVLKGNEYTLLSSVADVPADWKPPAKPKAATAADWKKWLTANTPEPPPGRFPTKPVVDALATWPAESIEQVLNRLITSAQEISVQEDPSAQAAEGWLRAVAQASLRWRDVAEPDSRGREAARVGELLARLSRIAGERTPLGLLFQAGALDGQPEAWREGFLAGLWYIFGDEDAHQIYLQSSETLGRQARDSLARELFIAAFDPNFSEQRHRQLDRLLDALPESHRTWLLQEAVASAPADQRVNVLGYLANSRHAQGAEHLPLRTTAALLLSGGQGDLASRTSRELADALKSVDAYGPELGAVLAETQNDVEKAIADKDREIAKLRETYEAELESERQAKARFLLQAQELGAEVDALQDRLRSARENTSQALNGQDR